MILAIARNARTPRITVVMQAIVAASSVFVKYSSNEIMSDAGADIVAATVKRSNLPANEVLLQREISRSDKSASKATDTTVSSQLCFPIIIADEKISKMPAVIVIIGGSKRKKLAGRRNSFSTSGAVFFKKLKLN